MLAITFHFDLAVGGVPSVPLASFAGSLGALGIVYALATARRRGLSTTVLLLAGVTMTAFFSALILFMQYLADFTDTFRTVRWLMGMLDVGSYTPLAGARCRCWRWRSAWSPRCRGRSISSALAPMRRRLAASTCQRAERLALVSASLATGRGRVDQRPGRVRRPGRAAHRSARRRIRSSPRAAGGRCSSARRS